ncbi:hypothetical protein JDV02_007134 [Purpureocillium takamizusanense]|uniref:Nucleoside phosphorylase domain-containing protein n=1 Tax=Purpureocillium takamizusanense TaxID=2060973 RepID=A0A9Q8QKY1_9HYPO|nr:uncharacterized protein JDV02_007134 [Purpureocillium takamizusanense]UNI21117.1 hypothetical protein JDV02_007134 [Purpureocillium takamizusanense]
MSDPFNYSFGWLCALLLEFEASKKFLDEVHQGPAKSKLDPYDENLYALGRIGQQNVVIAAPPADYGFGIACEMALNVRRSFPNITHGLLVGIGGGAPSRTADIRLGDLVVGCPSQRGGDGGIISLRSNEVTFAQGEVSPPPPALARIANRLESEHEALGHQLERSIGEVLSHTTVLDAARFERPDASQDRLHEAHDVHPPDESPGCSVTCGPDPEHLMERVDRGSSQTTLVHYGVIGSCNYVEKDAKARDMLSAARDILCFEMEAAGLVGVFPSLVIRGICDYSDSHKSKEWQGHAAMVAAAYAKQVVEIVGQDDSSDPHTPCLFQEEL